MRLRTEFLKLPYRFDVDRLVQEVSAIDPSEWMPHPTGFKGNSSVPLISVHGAKNDLFSGPMKITPALQQCEYIQQIIERFDSVVGRSRLMRLEGRCQVPEHSDINYHWYNRVRIHIPVITDPEVRFICNSREINMKPGETWIFDTWKLHQVINQNDITRIHLVIDTCGSSAFWDMVASASDPFDEHAPGADSAVEIPYVPGRAVNIMTEKYNTPAVMSPGELDALCNDLVDDLLQAKDNDPLAARLFVHAVQSFCKDWRQLWARFGEEPQGIPGYQQLLDTTRNKLKSIPAATWLASNLTDATNTLNARVLSAALGAAADQNATGNEYGDLRTTQPAAVTRLPAAKTAAKPGRNDPCPCGSGKKYKRCHG